MKFIPLQVGSGTGSRSGSAIPEPDPHKNKRGSKTLQKKSDNPTARRNAKRT